MKPIVIIKEKNKNGNFELTEKELRGLIEQAYKQGFDEGKSNVYTIQGWGTSTPIDTHPNWVYCGDTSTDNNPSRLQTTLTATGETL